MVPALQAGLERLEREQAAVRVGIEHRLEKKSRHIEKHRARLIEDADKVTQERLDTLLAHIEELGRLRDDLVEGREAGLWARLYGAEAAQRNPPWSYLGAGTKMPHTTIGTNNLTDINRVLTALKQDAEQIATAASEEQRRLIGPAQAPSLRTAAVWENTPEGQQAMRDEKAKQRADFEREWGPQRWGA